MFHNHFFAMDIYVFFPQARLVMLFISACTFAVRWIAKPKPLVDNMLSVSRCYSSLNCINVARCSGRLFVFLSRVCVCMCVRIGVCLCVFGHCAALLVCGCVNMPIVNFMKVHVKLKFQLIIKGLSMSPWLNEFPNTVFTFAPPLLTYNTASGHSIAPIWWNILLN